MCRLILLLGVFVFSLPLSSASLMEYLRFSHFNDPSWDYEASRNFIAGQKFDSQKLNLILREEWGARAPRGALDPLGSVFGIVLHHSLTPDNHSVQAIQNHHMDGNHWDDIGYHYVIARDEQGVWQVFQGRVEDRLGAHAGRPINGVDPDLGKIGISMVGNFGRRSSENPDGWSPGSPEHRRQPERRVQRLLGNLIQDILERHPTVTDFYTHRSPPHNVNPEGGVCPGEGAMHVAESFMERYRLNRKFIEEGAHPLTH